MRQQKIHWAGGNFCKGKTVSKQFGMARLLKAFLGETPVTLGASEKHILLHAIFLAQKKDAVSRIGMTKLSRFPLPAPQQIPLYT